MPQMPSSQEKLRARVDPIINLLNRQRIFEELARRQSPRRADMVEGLVHRQALAEVGNRVNLLPPADIAHLLEMLPPGRREAVWSLVADGKAGEVLWELSDPVAQWLVQRTDRDRLAGLCRGLDADTLSQIANILPEDLLPELEADLAPRTRSWLKAVAGYPDHAVGRLMSHDMVVIDRQAMVKAVFRTIRNLTVLPDNMDAVFVVDERDRLVGQLPLKTVLLHRPRQVVAAIMDPDVITFSPEEDLREAASAFERYDLVSAPVVDERRRLVGRLTVDVVMDFVREQASESALKREGLQGDEDPFGPVWLGARRRWLWLGINLLTAFIASRAIGLFEGSIEKLVALATLMPIVASIGGNTGNQTVALIVRGFALGQITPGNLRYLAVKEGAIALINGVLWGSVMGAVAWALYGDPGLGAVMAAATLLNLLIAALVGILVPYALHRMERDPALGSSVLLTFSTDGMGFFIFLGLATLFLIPSPP